MLVNGKLSFMNLKAEYKNFKKPEEVRSFPLGRVELIQLGGATIGRAIFEPGWRWSESVQPLAGTKSCLAPHLQFHVSGVMHVLMDDGTELECGPGDVSFLPEGHDAWTVGNESVEVIDFHGMLDYAHEKQVRAEKSLNRLIMESPIPMLIQDGFMSDALVKVNQRFYSIIGYETESMPDLDTFWQRVIPDRSYRQKMAKLWDERLQASSENPVDPIEMHLTCEDKSQRIFDVHLTKTDVQSIAVFVDLTEQYQLKDYLSYTSLHDELTGILNRRGYTQEVAKAWRLANFADTILALIMIDIDHFKQYNDSYGHTQGDQCLKQVAQTLQNNLRRSGDTVSRIGGEEFAILLQNTSKTAAMDMAEKVRKSIEQLNIKHENSPTSNKVTISIGMVIKHRSDTRTHEQLMEEADKHLYQAKALGRNCISTNAADKS